MQQRRDEEHENASWLIEEVVRKLDSVFLWLVLVVASLVSSLRNGDNLCSLRLRLARLPPDLEHLFGNMLKSIDALYREDVSQIFQIFRTSGHRLTIPALERVRFDEYHRAIGMKTPSGVLKDHEVENELQRSERALLRLNNRCVWDCSKLLYYVVLENPKRMPRVSSSLTWFVWRLIRVIQVYGTYPICTGRYETTSN